MYKLGAPSVLAGAMCVTMAVLAEPLDPVYLERFGGTYALDCEEAQGERVSVFEDRLVFADGDIEWVAEDILPSLSYWGRMPPEGWEIALLGENPPERSMIFLVYSDEEGLYIVLEGGRPDEPQDADSDADETRYRKCES